MRLLIEAYGCSLNRGEAAEFVDAAIELGHSFTDSEEDVEGAVLFTCGVIETTENRMLKRIGQLSDFKTLLICGCLGNIAPERVLATAPHAQLFSPSEHDKALDELGLGGRQEAVDGLKDSAIGILPIATGCLGSCAYCVTKLVRGDLQSRKIDDIVRRAGELTGRGAIELQICAQDSAIYGRDIGTDLNSLISELSSLNGDFMMRIGMMNLNSALKDLEGVLAAYENQKVFKFLHIPVQSGSDSVLQRMGREYSVDEFLSVLEMFRERFSDSTISTDIITGFPGETDEEFEDTVKLMKIVGPDIVNVTRFSPRPGTAAAVMEDQIPSRISKERSRALTDVRFQILQNKLNERIGKIVPALATEYRQPGTTFLRTKDYWPIVIEGKSPLGRWYEIKIIGSEKTHLRGEIYTKP